MKNFLKKLKEKFLLKTTVSELVLLIAIAALITIKFISINRSSKINLVNPVGDFGLTPYEIHINSQ